MKGLNALRPLSGRIVNNIIGGGIRRDRMSRNMGGQYIVVSIDVPRAGPPNIKADIKVYKNVLNPRDFIKKKQQGVEPIQWETIGGYPTANYEERFYMYGTDSNKMVSAARIWWNESFSRKDFGYW